MKWWLKVILIIGLMALGWGIFLELNKESKKQVVNVEVKKEQSVKIVIMADIHDDWKEWQKALSETKTNGDELVVIAGDMTLNGTKEELMEAKKTLEASGVKFLVVPGNHDVWQSLKKDDVYGEVLAPKYQSVKIDNLKLILIDNSSWLGLGAGQWQWINSEVKECAQITCLAIMHMPLNNQFSTHIMGEDRKATAVEAANLLKLLVANGVEQIEAGHIHYASSYELEGIRTDIVGAITSTRNTQTPRFTELTITGNQIERKVVEVDQ